MNNLRLELPVRIDFLGGWTDQECWEGPGAVLNAAVGWGGRYPLALSTDGKWSSLVEGEGTGLGISSIRHAAEWLMHEQDENWVLDQLTQSEGATSEDKIAWLADITAAQVSRAFGATDLSPREISCGIAASVIQERNSTRGGWQDAAGALYGGLKVVGGVWPDLHCLTIPEGFSGGALFDTVVLFDTGYRRDSAVIGDKVRWLLNRRDEKLCRILKGAAENAPRLLFATDLREAALFCAGVWGLLCECAPEMQGPPMPSVTGPWGYKLCGAGGGGYGLLFCDPQHRERDRDELLARGYWATIPELLPGPRWVSNEPE